MGVPLSLFTCLFAVGRGVGWIAQWKESIEDPTRKISRPRQVYVGEPSRPYLDFEARAKSSLRSLPSFTDSMHGIPYNYGVGHQST